ncbi:MAG: hypothetical protein LBO02_00170 [Holosporaceae bacterium]|jgi:putative effector of murein hydrolase|nr:hypothetical protein [Holosporaceae bacterium]
MKKLIIGTVLATMFSINVDNAEGITFGTHSNTAAAAYQQNIGPKYKEYAVAMYGVFSSIQTQLKLMTSIKSLSPVKSAINSASKKADAIDTFFHGLAVDLKITSETKNGTKALTAISGLMTDLGTLAGNPASAPFALRLASTLEGLRQLLAELAIPPAGQSYAISQNIIQICNTALNGLAQLRNTASQNATAVGTTTSSYAPVYNNYGTSAPVTGGRGL